MTPSELITELRNRNVHLWIEQDKLKYKAPKGKLTPELLGHLRDNKEAIIASLFHLEALTEADPDNLVVLLKQGDFEQPPLFLIHEGRGDVSAYAHLALNITGNRRVYGIKPQAGQGSPVVYPSLEAMATDYLHQIQKLQPQGPYLIGGLCIGGVVAFEISMQLQARGETVALVLLLDSIAKGANRRPEGKKAALRRFQKECIRKKLLTEEFGKDSGMSIEKAWRIVMVYGGVEKYYFLKDINKFIRKYRSLLEKNGLIASQEKRISTGKVLLSLLKGYQPQSVLKGSALLIKSTSNEDGPSHSYIYDDHDFGWKKWIEGPIQVSSINTSHTGMLERKNALETARIINYAISKALLELQLNAEKDSPEKPSLATP